MFDANAVAFGSLTPSVLDSYLSLSSDKLLSLDSSHPDSSSEYWTIIMGPIKLKKVSAGL